MPEQYELNFGEQKAKTSEPAKIETDGEEEGICDYCNQKFDSEEGGCRYCANERVRLQRKKINEERSRH